MHLKSSWLIFFSPCPACPLLLLSLLIWSVGTPESTNVEKNKDKLLNYPYVLLQSTESNANTNCMIFLIPVCIMHLPCFTYSKALLTIFRHMYCFSTSSNLCHCITLVLQMLQTPSKYNPNSLKVVKLLNKKYINLKKDLQISYSHILFMTERSKHMQGFHIYSTSLVPQFLCIVPKWIKSFFILNFDTQYSKMTTWTKFAWNSCKCIKNCTSVHHLCHVTQNWTLPLFTDHLSDVSMTWFSWTWFWKAHTCLYKVP